MFTLALLLYAASVASETINEEFVRACGGKCLIKDIDGFFLRADNSGLVDFKGTPDDESAHWRVEIAGNSVSFYNCSKYGPPLFIVHILDWSSSREIVEN